VEDFSPPGKFPRDKYTSIDRVKHPMVHHQRVIEQ